MNFSMLELIIFSSLLSLPFTFSDTKKENCTNPVNDLSSQRHFIYSAIASDARYCATISKEIMSKKGGNAIDGAIAGILCTCSVNFHSCGIGGGAFLIYYNKLQKRSYAFDMREMAPGLAREDMFHSQESYMFGGKSIAVMGLVSSYYEIHQNYGRLKWDVLFKPVIKLLRNGFQVSENLEEAIISFFNKSLPSQFDELKNFLTNPKTGKPFRTGDKIRRLKLANTLEILSKEPYAMKNGSLVNKVISEITKAGGVITKNDLNIYKMKIRKPIVNKMKNGKTLHTLPPPCSGGLVAFNLNVLQNYKNPKYLKNCENNNLFYHRLVETLKFSYAIRSRLGDMDFVDVHRFVEKMTSKSYAKFIQSLIKDNMTNPRPYYGPYNDFKDDFGTSHFSLISADGDAVSITSSINYDFGSLVLGNETGIIYNDQMDDFSYPNRINEYQLRPSKSNFVRPYKRPMSSMSPIIVVDKAGNVDLVLGASGGSKIISSTTQSAARALLFQESIKTSIDAPRVHHQLRPNEILYEPNLPKPILNGLRNKGHKLKKSKIVLGVCDGIKRSHKNSNLLQCNADFRKGGSCDGS